MAFCDFYCGEAVSLWELRVLLPTILNYRLINRNLTFKYALGDIAAYYNPKEIVAVVVVAVVVAVASEPQSTREFPL